MDWWLKLNNMYQFMPDTPALAVSMALDGPQHDQFAYSLAYNMQNSPEGLDVYPAEGMTFPEGE